MSGLLKITAFLVVFMSQFSFAQNIIHIYSPWADQADQDLHITGQPTDWNPKPGGITQGVEEGGGWYSWNIATWQDWGTITGIVFSAKA